MKKETVVFFLLGIIISQSIVYFINYKPVEESVEYELEIMSVRYDSDFQWMGCEYRPRNTWDFTSTKVFVVELMDNNSYTEYLLFDQDMLGVDFPYDWNFHLLHNESISLEVGSEGMVFQIGNITISETDDPSIVQDGWSFVSRNSMTTNTLKMCHPRIQ